MPSYPTRPSGWKSPGPNQVQEVLLNSTAFTQFTSPDKEAWELEIALERLGAYLDAEQEALGRVIVLSGQRHVTTCLDDLAQLHIEADAQTGELRDLLEMAHTCLERLLEVVRNIPMGCRLASAWGPEGPAAFDVHVRWTGARLEEITKVLSFALSG